MRGIPLDKKSHFDNAVRTFRGEGNICVNTTNLAAFLDETQEIETPPEERLRQLAIALEFESFEKGWESLRAIYQAAANANPGNSQVFHSWGISACEWFEEHLTSEMTDRLAIASEAEKVFTIALDLEPHSGDIAYGLGQLYYKHPSRNEDCVSYLSKAIFWFRRAVEWDADNVMAQLYLAHCYHDLAYQSLNQKDWEQAIEAYEKVDQAQLARDWPAWRAVKCREQLAACYAWQGNKEEAIHRFSSFLDEIEALELDENGMHEAVVNIDELVGALTRKLGNAGLLYRARLQARRYKFEDWYEELFSDNI